MEVVVLSSGCANCRAQARIVEQAVAEMGLEGHVTREEDVMEVLRYEVHTLPAIVVDGKVVHSGGRLSLPEVKALLQELQG